MAIKTRRVEARIDPETDELIARAAAVAHESVSGFMVRAARAEADRVLARSDVTPMPAEQFDALIASLDQAEAASTLSRVAARPRRFQRG